MRFLAVDCVRSLSPTFAEAIMHPRRAASIVVVLPVLAVVAILAISACSSSNDVDPVAVSGEYVLVSFNGAAMKAHPDVSTTIDSGFANLNASGD